MFRAKIQWGEQGPVLKMEGKLVREWAEQARSLVTYDVVPTAMVVDLTEVSYVDCIGEQFLKWLAGFGATFVAGNVYTAGVCERLQLPPVVNMRSRRKRHSRISTEDPMITPSDLGATSRDLEKEKECIGPAHTKSV